MGKITGVGNWHGEMRATLDEMAAQVTAAVENGSLVGNGLG